MTSVLNRVFGDRTISTTDRLYQLEPHAKALLTRVPADFPQRQFLEYLLHYAQMLRTDAGYSGSHSDGGASRIETQVDVFICARIEHKLPEVWDDVIAMFNRQADPEYAEFLRLQKKFGAK